MKAKAAMTSIVFALSAAFLSASVSQAKEKPMTGRAEFVRRIDALAKVKKVTAKTVAAALGATLDFHKDESSADPVVSTAKAPAGAWFQTVELRKSKAGGDGGLVVVTVAPGLDVTPEDLLGAFGKDPQIDPASPHAPPEARRDYYVYARKGVELRFGLLTGAKRVVSEVVVDRP